MIERDNRIAYVMAMSTMMTMRMAPNLPSTATAAAGGTRPAKAKQHLTGLQQLLFLLLKLYLTSCGVKVVQFCALITYAA